MARISGVNIPRNKRIDIGVIKIKSKIGWSSIALIEGFGEVEENNKVLVLCNTAKEGGSINAKAARDELEKVTLLVDQATTLKEKLRVIKERSRSSSSCNII